MTKTASPTSQPLTQKERIVALGIYIGVAWLLFYLSTNTIVPTGSGVSVWLLAAVAYWLLSLVAAPYFTPPKDTFGVALTTITLLAPLKFDEVIQYRNELLGVNFATIIIAMIVLTIVIVSMFRRDPTKFVGGEFWYRAATIVGRGDALLTLPVVISILGFYQKSPGWMAILLACWTIQISMHPVETMIRLFVHFLRRSTSTPLVERAGELMRFDDPDLVRVNLSRAYTSWKPEVVHAMRLSNGKTTYILPLFTQIQDSEIVGTGLCCPIGTDQIDNMATGDICAVEDKELHHRLRAKLSGDEVAREIVGIVVEGSRIGAIRFQVVRGANLEKGMVVFTFVREKKIYYQVLDASTNEESFQQNPFGVHIVSASQLGYLDADEGFMNFPWLPDMNQPVFLTSLDEAPNQNLKADEFLIGKVPGTPFGVPVKLNDLIEYHTAILGMTGKGKTELAIEIIRKALDREVVVFCVDFTGDYGFRLKDKKPVNLGPDQASLDEFEKHLFDADFGEWSKKGELSEYSDKFRERVEKQITKFMEEGKSTLALLQLAEIVNTKATLRITEQYLSAVMTWAKAHRRAKKILIVLEEAHTIIPESFGSGFDKNTELVVSRIGQIALQGRKYGVGLLVLSQRTALVSKTVLSQCNTYFTHGLVDKTSLDYLSNVYSAEHVSTIPSLRFLEFIAYGKAVKSERPIIATREFDEEIKKAYEELSEKREAGEEEAVEEQPMEEVVEATPDSPGESETSSEQPTTTAEGT